ncbi:alpha/beta hydrolase [Chitinimonas sp.]|uniref:alpha/beta fold hydrolase n=1 Tax=Chitinimonas sp. TaxID=1934313 RepID=UPI002F94CAF9
MTWKTTIAEQRGTATTLLLAGLLLAGCASVPTTHVYRSTTGSVAYTRIGSGQPTVVLQAGLGDGKAAWAPLVSRLSPRYTVLAYDRPGYGDSADSTLPRDPCSVAVALHALLHAEGLSPPYVLVGHSLGGLYQYAYAQLYPQEVAGLVLVDATHPRHWQHMQAEVPTSAHMVEVLRATRFSAVMRREFDQQAECTDKLMAQAPLALPAKVLTRTDYDLYERGAFERMVKVDEQDWLRLTGARQVEPVAGSGHYIQRDKPEAVVAAIDALAAQAKAGR